MSNIAISLWMGKTVQSLLEQAGSGSCDLLGYSADAGADVIVLSRRTAEVAKTADEIEGEGRIRSGFVRCARSQIARVAP